MGSGNFDVTTYKAQASAAKRSESAGFDAKSMCDEFNPAKVGARFSRTGPFNYFREVITVLVGLDVTGSMDVIPKSLLQGGLGSLMVDLKQEFNGPHENLQISFAGIGDAKSDEAPLQVTHFESDNRFAQQLPKIWLEGKGGANGAESYNLLWWYAANKTQLNYVRASGRKGVLITIGDDNVHPTLTASEIQMWLDPSYDGGDISNEVLLDAVREQYDVYHIVITNGYAFGYDFTKRAKKSDAQKRVEAKQWEALLGHDKVIPTNTDGVADAIAGIVKRHRPASRTGIGGLSTAEWEKENLSSLTDEQWQEVLSYALCPISRQFMRYPVVWGDSKRAYERSAVIRYTQEHEKDPVTGQKLTGDLVLRINPNIAQLCANYKASFEALPAERAQRIIDAMPHDESGKTTVPTGSAALFSSAGAGAGAGAAAAAAAEAGAAAASADSSQATGADGELESFLICPITQEVMRTPVMLSTGQTYEKDAIEGWLKTHDTDPMTGETLTDKKLTENYALKSLCDDYYKRTRLAP